MKIDYLCIRMWAPADECDNPTEPHYVAKLEGENRGVGWTVTRVFCDAHFFQSIRVTMRVLRSVKRLADRVARGWLYEVIQIQEEIVASNVPTEEKEAAL